MSADTSLGADATAGSDTAPGSDASGATDAAASDVLAPANCPHAALLLDVSTAPGAGSSYAKPTLAGTCSGDYFLVTTNGITPYKFVAMTPNPLTAKNATYKVPLKPAIAAAATQIGLGSVGVAVNGMAIYGPMEGPQPTAEIYGDPIYNGLTDGCNGHTSPGEYHYHALMAKCLTKEALISEPWALPEPDASKASPLLGWALDGFPIYGPNACKDTACTAVETVLSGYAKTGDPKTHAFLAYTWSAHAGDARYLDECNGRVGPDGQYRYHATANFPYTIACYRGTPSVAAAAPADMKGLPGKAPAGGTGGTGGTGGGPKSCAAEADCSGACPPGSKGCTCATTPTGKLCAPTCSAAADCPTGPDGAMNCLAGVCVPPPK